MHDFASLAVHLHLLLRVAVFGEYVDLRNQIVSKLIGKFFDRRFFTFEKLRILFYQLVHRSRSRSAGSLIRCHMHTFDMREFFDHVQRNNHLNRRTVRVCDDSFRACQRIFGIDFGYDQRDVFIHPEST